MKIPIRNSYGKKNGVITHVSDVVGGQQCGCVCIACGEPLLAKKGEQRAHHFAHRNDSACVETVLHKLGKTFLKARIDEAIETKERLPFAWKCEYCHSAHEADLMNHVSCCVEEIAFGSARADLGLLDQEGNLFAAVEIVVTHKPDESALASYRDKDVIVLEINLSSEADLALLKTAPVLAPQRVSVCLMPRCQACRAYLLQRKIHVVDADCWKCAEPMKMAFGNDGQMMMSPEDFIEPELQTARNAGAQLERRYSKTVRESYMANVCPSCDVISGSHFLHDFWYRADESGSTDIAMGCPDCGMIVSNTVGVDGARAVLREPEEPEEDVVAPKSAPAILIPEPVAPPPATITSTSQPKPTPSRPVSVWGRCGNCGVITCPSVLDHAGKFHCFSCGSRAQFIPDLPK